MKKEDLIEAVAKAGHESWRRRKAEEGITSRPDPQDGTEQMAPWSDLSEKVREDNRVNVRSMFEAMHQAGFDIVPRVSVE